MARLAWTVAVILVVSGLALAFSAGPVRAQQDSSGFPSITFESYTLGGQTTELGCGGTDCPSIPVGATVDIRVWVDLYNCDPVTIYFGAQGAGSQTVAFNGAFSMDFQHTYSTAGIYPVKAVMPTCPGVFDDVAPLSIGGSASGTSGLGGFAGPFDDSALFFMAFFAFWLGLIALLLAASAGVVGGTGGGDGVGSIKGRRVGAPPPTTPKPYIPFTQPYLDGMPYMESTHWGSFRDIPPGARRVDPGRIPFQPGTTTDVWQAPPCPDGCGDLVYTAAGWYCPDPDCPGRNSGTTLTAFPKVGEFYG
ncbi:MAG: hypothetical protein ABSB97_08525 [Thermoplasmata archaeon]|jgi:hypothetical protein